ncbi:hypothetical protein EQM14_01665 [Caproiciproducens sp. NJN-50]|uniref:hypothetical protein n=1 Tax=Caproiciproducens sp. NJN-50 TaxID=2507162 RepID=UPI000FFE3273|nr:hypothetical protein [Caproiciproducens sp. NJN-50]QAT48591.1 hypothetical protein EQM14_01665 [Caproiciproducens sp. NJN-50]
MVKVKTFKQTMFHTNLDKMVNSFIKENNISAENIISVVPVSAPVYNGSMVAKTITLTYNE